MKFIKVTTSDGEKAILNVNNVVDIYQVSESETTICFDGQNYMRVNIPFDEFEKQFIDFINDDSKKYMEIQ